MALDNDLLEEPKISLDESVDSPYVLVVDDLPSTRALVIDMLKDMGFHYFKEAESGADALNVLKKSRAGFIISDHIMKDMTGLEFLSEIRNYPYLADIPFLIMSAQSDMGIFDASIKLGAVDFILKPINYNTLSNKIFRILKMNKPDESF